MKSAPAASMKSASASSMTSTASAPAGKRHTRAEGNNQDRDQRRLSKIFVSLTWLFPFLPVVLLAALPAIGETVMQIPCL